LYFFIINNNKQVRDAAVGSWWQVAGDRWRRFEEEESFCALKGTQPQYISK
jgi:hypothetical protein